MEVPQRVTDSTDAGAVQGVGAGTLSKTARILALARTGTHNAKQISEAVGVSLSSVYARCYEAQIDLPKRRNTCGRRSGRIHVSATAAGDPRGTLPTTGLRALGVKVGDWIRWRIEDGRIVAEAEAH